MMSQPRVPWPSAGGRWPACVRGDIAHPVALDVISEMAKVEGGVVGAGTLLTPQDVKNAVNAGATFGVSPGATDTLLDACEAADLPRYQALQPQAR